MASGLIVVEPNCTVDPLTIPEPAMTSVELPAPTGSAVGLKLVIDNGVITVKFTVFDC